MKNLIRCLQCNFILTESSVRTSTSAPVLNPGADTMYTNMANLQQTMLLQQRMFLQALCQQNTLGKSTTTTTADTNTNTNKKFIAPSLSQYRFVSGQQVSKLLYKMNLYI